MRGISNVVCVQKGLKLGKLSTFEGKKIEKLPGWSIS